MGTLSSTRSYTPILTSSIFPQHCLSVGGTLGLFTNFVTFSPNNVSIGANQSVNITPGSRLDEGAVTSCISVSGVNIVFSKSWFGVVSVTCSNSNSAAIAIAVNRQGSNELLGHYLKAGGLFSVASVSCPVLASASSGIYVAIYCQNASTVSNIKIRLLSLGNTT